MLPTKTTTTTTTTINTVSSSSTAGSYHHHSSSSKQSPLKRKTLNNRSSSVITLGCCATILLSIFICMYVVALTSFLGSSSAPKVSEHRVISESMKKVGDLKIPVGNVVDRLNHWKDDFSKVVGRVRRKNSLVDQIFESTMKEMDEYRQKQKVQRLESVANAKNKLPSNSNIHPLPVVPPAAAVIQKQTNKSKKLASSPAGIIVLGMHRSGTSMLSGLLVQGLGYKTGGPLIGQSFDNAKGFFERVDIVLQNDEFLGNQKANWDSNVIHYDSDKALQQKEEGVVTFQKGTPGLQFLNDKKNWPYLQKDPRMCITLKTWLALLNHQPAIVFTYRHPLEVAKSLRKRNKIEGFPHFPLEKGFRLWIVYNMRAIQNSNGLCRVTSSNDAILSNPLTEVQRIVDDLTFKCGVPAPPKRKLAQTDVDVFVDKNLQHSKDKQGGGSVLTQFDDCKVMDYESEFKSKDGPGYKREHAMYLKAMKVYCDLESGAAYQDGYTWPKLA